MFYIQTLKFIYLFMVGGAVAKCWSARLEIEGSVVRASGDTLYCVLEEDTLSSAIIVWYNPGKVST